MRVSDILQRKGASVCTIDDGQKLGDATYLMHEAKVGAVVVRDRASDRPVGIISQSEILAALHDDGAVALARNATSVMRRPAPHCTASASIQDAMAQMTRERARHLVIIDDAGAMAGIVSMGDLVAARIGAAELEANVLRDMARCHIMSEAAAA